MALQENFSTYSYVSEGVVDQYTLVGAGTVKYGAVPAGAGALAIGTVLNRSVDQGDGLAGAGQALTVANNGIVKVVAGAALSVGDAVTPDANGLAAVGSTGDVAIGVAIDDAAAGEVAEVHWLGPWVVA